jgi:hypothetical protein
MIKKVRTQNMSLVALEQNLDTINKANKTWDKTWNECVCYPMFQLNEIAWLNDRVTIDKMLKIWCGNVQLENHP